MPEQLSGLLINATSTPPWYLRPVKISTYSELYPDFFRVKHAFKKKEFEKFIANKRENLEHKVALLKN